MFNESLFIANPLAYFKENGWVLNKENRTQVLITLGKMAEEKVRYKQIYAILLNLAKYNPDLKKVFTSGANKLGITEECERDKKRKIEMKFNDYALTQTNSSKLKKALAILCMVWAIQGMSSSAPTETSKNIKSPTAITRTVNENNKYGDKKMTLKEFIMKEGLCGNAKCAKDFEDDKEVEEVPAEEGGKFEFKIKATVAADSQKEAMDKLMDALSGNDFSKVKAKAAEEKKEEKAEDEEPAEEEAARKFKKSKSVIRKVTEIEHPEEGCDAGACAAGKKFKKEAVCPQCGKVFSKCTCGK